MNWLNKVLLLVWILGDFTVSSQSGTAEYYENLIKEEIGKTWSYVPPSDLSEYKFQSNGTIAYGNYDYIIVGAGSTGSVLANRLSEIKTNSILLLEAGGAESDFTEIPAMAVYLQQTPFNWNYITTPQWTSCLGMFNRQCQYPRGRGLGGSNIINMLMYVRGNKEDYNGWHEGGNPGWSYKDVLPYFIKSENSQINGDKGYHGVEGNINVEFPESTNPHSEAFLNANLELGRNLVDYNGKSQLGVSKIQYSTAKGRRNSVGKAFLQPAMRRSNLKVLTHSLVIKILIDAKSKAAYGVLFSRNGHLFKAKARKEVIISAGAVASPQIMMLSGIGPQDHLQELGIPVVKSLDVGKNLQEHPAYFSLYVETNYTTQKQTFTQSVNDFLINKGLFTLTLKTEIVGFYKTKHANTSDAPDVEILLVSPNGGSLDLVQKTFNYADQTIESIWKKIDWSNNPYICIFLLHPRSRGQITLKSSDPLQHPFINLRLLSDPKGVDIDTMYEGIKLALEMINTEAFKKLNATLAYARLPACQKYRYLSRGYWYCHLRQLTAHVYHPVGTCKMGPDPNKGAVVNHELKVYGIKNLRVADASIIPDAISGHTNAVCMMIGEKLADMIKRENKR